MALKEVWKRRFILCSVLFLIVNLIGVILIAIEISKLQRYIANSNFITGLAISVGGMLPVYAIFGYTIIKHDQYPSGPVLILGNAIYVLLGSAFLCVARTVPASLMYDMVSFVDFDRDQAVSGAYKTPFENVTEPGAISSEHEDKMYVFDADERYYTTAWNEELIGIIQYRLTLLGSGIAIFGLLGGTVVLAIIYKTHRLMEERKECIRGRRKHISTLARNIKPEKAQRFRDSVYDYAGWGNRTSYNFHEPDPDEHESMTQSVISLSVISPANMATLIEDDAPQHLESAPVADDEHYQYGAREAGKRQQNGFLGILSERGTPSEMTGASSYEMKKLCPSKQHDGAADFQT